MSCNDDTSKLTRALEKLTLTCSSRAIELKEKRTKANYLQRSIDSDQAELIDLQRQLRLLKVQRDSTKFIDPPPVLDSAGAKIKIGILIEIINKYTNFSTKLPKPRGFRKPIIRGTSVAGYDPDKFGTVEYIQRTDNSYKVYFITDSGYQTWRAPTNLLIYNGERGSIDETTEESFHDTRSE